MTKSAIHQTKKREWRITEGMPKIPQVIKESPIQRANREELQIQVLRSRWMSLWNDIEDKLRNKSGPIGQLPMLDFNDLLESQGPTNQGNLGIIQVYELPGSNGKLLSSINKIQTLENIDLNDHGNFLHSSSRKPTERVTSNLVSQKPSLLNLATIKNALSEMERIIETRVDEMEVSLTSTIEGLRRKFDSTPQYLPPGAYTKLKDYHQVDLVSYLREIAYFALDWRVYVEEIEIKSFYSKILNTAVVRCSMLTTGEPLIYRQAKVIAAYKEPSNSIPDEILVLDPKRTSLNLFILLDVLIRIVLRYLGRPNSSGEELYQFVRAGVITLCRDTASHVLKSQYPPLFLKVDEVSTIRVQQNIFEWVNQAIGRYTDEEIYARQGKLQSRADLNKLASQQGKNIESEDDEAKQKDEDNAQSIPGSQQYRDLILDLLNHSRQWLRMDAAPDPTALKYTIINKKGSINLSTSSIYRTSSPPGKTKSCIASTSAIINFKEANLSNQ
jgi:hypothetical protein